MSMAIIGVAGTVIGAGASIYGTMSQQQAAKKAAGANANGLHVGTKPKAAEYKPVDFSHEQLQTVWANQDALHNIIPMDATTNAYIDQDALTRANKLIPNFKQNMQLEGSAAHSLMQGQLPYDDVLGIAAKSNELGNAMGTPGGSSPATLRDLGISRLGAIQSGAGLMKGMVDMAEQVDPVSRRASPQAMFLDPMTMIQNRMQQNQLIQQSNQNKYNIEAAPTPTDAINAQLALAGRTGAIGGGSVGGGAGGYASAIQGLISGLGKAYAGSGGGGVGLGSGGYSVASDPGLSATGGTSIFGNPLYTNPSSTYSSSIPQLSYRPNGMYNTGTSIGV